MTQVILNPHVKINRASSVDNALEIAEQLHAEAHKFCFIANSVNTEIVCQPQIEFS
jgi:organic hydroperoxide reductase OsmC/OhrA